MAFHRMSRLIQQILVLLFAVLVVVFATPLDKRATQVSLNSYTFSNNVLAGSINVSFSHFSSSSKALSEIPSDPKHCLC